jgi:4-diphosphocytidyl-2C-methyl-D-erythritol kinase
MKIKSAALSQNKNLVEYEAVLKWDGKLPEMMMGGGSVPFINLNTNKGSK